MKIFIALTFCVVLVSAGKYFDKCVIDCVERGFPSSSCTADCECMNDEGCIDICTLEFLRDFDFNKYTKCLETSCGCPSTPDIPFATIHLVDTTALTEEVEEVTTEEIATPEILEVTEVKIFEEDHPDVEDWINELVN